MEEELNQSGEKQEEAVPGTPSEAGDLSDIDERSKRLVEAEKQVEQYKDLLLRKAAEFDNYKKRVDNEAATVLKFARVDLISDLLPIVDDFERSLKLGKDRKESESFSKGVELIYQKLIRFLESHGLKAMETVGKEFDVHYHDALLQIQRTDVPPHTVVEEVEKGYLLDDRVIRHAKVVVSSSPMIDETTSEASAEKPPDRAIEPSAQQVPDGPDEIQRRES
ncbi:MAG TPA: nucleotide exchange factor GrpE [Bacteroidetes bacterium]|nr:nucleotide exchange factor GrpE [Bacteroidota bacterium]